MKFEEALPILRNGGKIRRKAWDTGSYIYASKGWIYHKERAVFVLAYCEILEPDWEVCIQMNIYQCERCEFKAPDPSSWLPVGCGRTCPECGGNLQKVDQ